MARPVSCVIGYAQVHVQTRTASTSVGDICKVIFERCHISRRELGSVKRSQLKANLFLIQTSYNNAMRILTVRVKGWQFFVPNGDHIRPVIPSIKLKTLFDIIYVQLICPEKLLQSQSSDYGGQGTKSSDEIGKEIVTRAEADEGVYIIITKLELYNIVEFRFSVT